MNRSNPQKYLYGTGSLSLVWQLGTGSIKVLSCGRHVKDMVLRAELTSLCNKILRLLEIPRPMSNVNTTTYQIKFDQQGFNIKEISFLLLGLHIIYKVQAEDLRRKLKVLYEQCRRRYYGESIAIDLPGVEINRQAQITMDMSRAQNIDDFFGEPFIEFGFGEPVSPRTHFQHTPIHQTSPVLEQSFETGQPTDVMSILRKTKKVQRAKRRLTKQNENNVEDLESDTALLNYLQQNNVTNLQDITMIEDSIPQGHPNGEENIRFDHDFERDVNNQSTVQDVGVENFNDQSTVQDVGAEDMSSLIQPNQQRELSLELLPRQEQTPHRRTQMSDSFRLDRIIRGTENERTPGEVPVVEPSRKRRRTQRFDDTEVKLSVQQMQENLASGVLNSQQKRELLNALLAPHPKLNFNFPMNIRPVRFIERLQAFHGRKLKVQVLQDMVNQIQSSQFQLDEVVRRQNDENITRNDGDVTTLVSNTVMEDVTKSPTIEINNTRNTRNRISEVPEVSMQETTEIPNDNMYTTVIPSPPRESFPEENFPIQSPIQGNNNNNGPNLNDAQTDFAKDGRFFSDMFPPASTSKSQAAFQFNHFLKLQKKKKVIITQENFLGPMRIKSLNPTE